MKSGKRRVFWMMVAILFLAAALRFGTTTVHGLDGDDGFSLRVAQEYSTGDFVRYFAWAETIDQHPKLYFLALHLWIQAAGISLLALRSLSIFADLLLGAFLIQSARVLFDDWTAVVAGVLWAVNPLLIWVDGLVRMYGFLAVLGTLAWLSLLRALLTPHRGWWAAFALTAAAAAYTQILGVIVLAAAGAVLAWWGVTRRRLTGLFVLAGVGLVYLPYMIQMWGRRAPRTLLAQEPPTDLPQYIQQFAAGLLGNRPPVHPVLLWGVVLLAVVLLAAVWRAWRRWPAITPLLILLLTAPAGFTYFVLDAGIFQTKFFAFIAPLALLILAVGLRSLAGKALRGGLLLGLVGFGLLGFVYQLQPAAWEDFPSAARYIETQGGANDLIIVMSSYGGPPFRYHYTGPARVIDPWFGISEDMPLDDLFAFVTQGYDTVWLVFYQGEIFDPGGLMDSWFRARYPLRAEVYPNRVVVRAYDLRPMTDDLPAEATPLEARFGDIAALRGYRVAEDVLPRRENRMHPPSNWVHVTLFLGALQADQDFRPQVTLESQAGQVYGGVLARDDDLFVRHPSRTWQPGQVWRYDADLNLNPEIPPGDYKIVLRMMNGAGETLPVDEPNSGIDWAIVTQVQITP